MEKETETQDMKLWISTQIHGETMEQWQTLVSSAPKSLQMVTAAMKLKDVWSLKEKLWQTPTVC